MVAFAGVYQEAEEVNVSAQVMFCVALIVTAQLIFEMSYRYSI